MYIKKLNYCLIIFIVISLSFAKADVLSITQSGDSKYILEDSQHIEGFFFGEIPSNASNITIPGGGTDICKIIQSFDLSKKNALSNLKTALYYVGFSETDKDLEKTINNCGIKFSIYQSSNLWIILIAICILAFLTIYNRKRLIALLLIKNS